MCSPDAENADTKEQLPQSTPASFYECAIEFIEAAETLWTKQRPPSIAATGLLLSHGLEVGLKAYLLHCGWTPDGCRKISHNLEKAWWEAYKAKLPVQRETPWEVRVLNSAYMQPFLFRYPREGVSTALPEPNALFELVKEVLDKVEKGIGYPD